LQLPLLFLVLFTMPTTFERLYGPAEPLGSTWLGSANVPFSPVALHHLVVSTDLLEASQARSGYGHWWRTKTLCKSDQTLQYWKSPCDLPAYLTARAQELNSTELSTIVLRLTTLQAAPVGCILVVVQCITATATSPTPPPVIMLIAAPSLATLGILDKEEDEPGLFLADI
jgi:hypothetical protein